MRSGSARTERAGLIAVETACHDLNLIWRDLFQDDVGVDGTIEICLGDFPTGKIVGAQVKSGKSYIKSDKADQFSFYPRQNDLEYWSQLSIPLFLLVYHPDDKVVYWCDVSSYIQQNANEDQRISHIVFPKENKMDEGFLSYLEGRFDLKIYDAGSQRKLREELSTLSIVLGHGEMTAEITGLDMFVEGLWGLCSKVLFHASILLSIIRRSVGEKNKDTRVSYTFSRSEIYPFLIRYFAILAKHHIATIDANDINNSLYQKMELPTFIAPLTTNGRAFVRFLREAGHPNARDNQFFTLGLTPIEQIEVYSSFQEVEGTPSFGKYTDVLAISFNRYLDYYNVQHFKRGSGDERASAITSQVMYFYELTEYVRRVFEGVAKDNILLRHLDLPLTPLISWLEHWYENNQPFHIDGLTGKTNSEQLGFHDEIISTFSGAGVLTISEPPLPRMPIKLLFNGEELVCETDG